MNRVLVIRPDRLGDVILSTPVIAALRKTFPKARISFLVTPYVAPIIRGIEGLDEVLEYEPDGRHCGPAGFIKLVREIRAGGFDAAVALQSQWRVAAAVFLAGVRVRIGPRSKLHSLVFYNRGVRQRRSQVEKHEADYNLDLLKPLGAEWRSGELKTRIHIDDDTVGVARAWLVERGWREGEPFAVVHPGMGGSALNWPEPFYADLTTRILAKGIPVLLTGGQAEAHLLERIRASVEFTPGAPRRVWIFDGGRGVQDLAGLYSFASLVVAPSTGPLHVAVALGKRVVTFYPDIPVQSPKRWGPYGVGVDQAVVLTPKLCDSSDMQGISVDRAIAEVMKQLGRAVA